MKNVKNDAKKGTSLSLKIGYVIFFLVIFFVAVYQLFPYDKVRTYLEVRLSEALRSDVQIKGLEFSPFSGVKLKGIVVEKAVKGETVRLIAIDELNVSSFIYSAVMFRKSKNMSMDVSSKLYAGELEGSIHIQEEKGIQIRSIELNLKDIDISKEPLIASLYNIRPFGRLNGKVSLEDVTADPSSSKGRITLTLSEGGVKGIVLNNIGSGFLKIDNMQIPDVSFDTARIDLVKEPQRPMKVKVRANGSDFSAEVSGNLNLTRNIRAASTNLIVKFNIADAYLQKDVTFSLMDENFKSFKDSNGFYNIKIDGALTRPMIRTM